jgi:uncharacterized protein YbjQ (UPF0145 family)
MADKKIVICSKCGQAFGLEQNARIPKCSECGGELVDSGILVPVWRQMSTDEKNEVVKRINESAYENRLFTIEEEIETSKILITSGYNFEGYTIVKYSGYISGDDAMEIPRSGIFGGNNGKNLTNALVNIRREAIKELKQAAYDLGCNAVIGVDFDYLTLEPETVSLGTHYLEPYVICVTANGTAVTIKKTGE